MNSRQIGLFGLLFSFSNCGLFLSNSAFANDTRDQRDAGIVLPSSSAENLHKAAAEKSHHQPKRHGSSARRTPVHHTASRRSHSVRPRRTSYRPRVHAYHGVFSYGPRPRYHRHYASRRPSQIEEQHLPQRSVERMNSFALGFQGGSIFSGYQDASGYADAGLGVSLRYRPIEFLGIEGSVAHYNQTFGPQTERMQTLGQANVELFAWPWSRVSPYVLGGVAINRRQFEDDRNRLEVNPHGVEIETVEHFSTRDVVWGPQIGAGIEFSIGQSFALDLEARYTGYLGGREADPTSRGALQTTIGAKMHF